MLRQTMQSNKLLSDPLHPTSSRAKNKSVLGPYKSGADFVSVIASAPDNVANAHGIHHNVIY